MRIKSIIVSVGFLFAVVSNIVSAQSAQDFVGKELDLKFYKGWNLVGVNMLQFIDNEPGAIRAMYLFDSRINKFVGGSVKKFESNPHIDNIWNDTWEYLEKINEPKNNNDKWFSFFVYLNKDISGTMRMVSQTMLEQENLYLVKGWNPVSMDSLLPAVGRTFKEVAGNCKIERLYGFNNQTHKFIKISFTERIDGIFNNLGDGVFIKTGNSCHLDFTGDSNISMPPNLPN